MPYTSADLAQRIATRLGACGDGQPVEAEDARKIRDGLPSIVADLETRGIAAFPDLDRVPEAAFLHLAAIAAAALADEFGLPQDEIVTLASRAQAAEQKLRQHHTLPYVGEPMRVEYF